MQRIPRRRPVLPFALSVLLLACVGDSPTGPGPDPGTEKNPGPARLEVVSGSQQAGTTGSSLALPLVVRVLDGSGKPLSGVQVTWSATQGGGTLSPAATPTDSTGEARTRWTLGSSPGAQTATATVSQLPPVSFAATAALPTAAKVEGAGGDGQTGTAGEPLAAALAVRVVSAEGRPVPGVAVGWSVTAGGGSVSASGALTDSAGVASARWVLGATAGPNTVEARAGELAGSPVVFRATGAAGSAAAISRVSGDGQSARAGSALPAPLAVRVADARGNPVEGASVTWMVTGGGGSVAPGLGTTDAEGVARATWTVGATPGSNTLTAAAGGATVAFAATGTPGEATAIHRVSGDAQTGMVGTALASPLVVRLTDAGGSPVAGAVVTWAATAGGGSVAPESATTGADGTASARWTLGSTAGAQTVSASAGNASITFSATGVPAVTSRIALVSGNGQSGIAGSALSSPIVVKTTDAHGNPTAGVMVDWNVLGTPGGSFDPALSTTGADGTTSSRWTLRAGAGANEGLASPRVPNVDPVRFTATGTTGGLSSVIKAGGDEQSGTVGQPLSTPITIRATDVNGNGVPGVSVTWTPSGDGKVESGAATTDASGFASARWTLGSTAGTQTLSANVGGIVVTFSATALSGPPPQLRITGGNDQTGDPGVTLPQPLVIQVLDSGGTPMQGVAVKWAITSYGGGSLAPTSTTTGADGTASAVWTLGSAPGFHFARAEIPWGLSAGFTATVRSGSAGAITLVGGDGQSGTVGTQLPQELAVKVTDAAGNPMVGATMTWTVSPGGGHLPIYTSGTGGDGIARANWVLGTTAGAHTVTVSSGGRSLTFTGTATPDAATQLVPVSGTGQTSSAGSVLPAPLVVRAADRYGNPAPAAGLTVAWVTTKGIGAVSPTTSSIGADGTASTRWTLGVEARSQGVRASAAGISTPAAFSATATGVHATTLSISPATASVEPGKTLQLSFTATDVDGAALSDPALSWASSNGEVATVDGSGLVTGVSSGTVTVTATSGGTTATATVTVAPPDQTPPEVTGFSISPLEVDVTSAPGSVAFTLTARDASGISTADGVHRFVEFRSPGGGSSHGCVPQLASGTVSDGTWKCTASIPSGSQEGEWPIHSITLQDNAGNRRVLTGSDLQALGFPSTFRVKNDVKDTAPPVLTGFSFTPASVSVASGPASVEFTVSATDASTGVSGLVVEVTSPGGDKVLPCLSFLRVSGTAQSGTWKCTLSIPQGSAGGVWSVTAVRLSDAAHNNRAYATAELKAAGFPTEITVTT